MSAHLLQITLHALTLPKIYTIPKHARCTLAILTWIQMEFALTGICKWINQTDTMAKIDTDQTKLTLNASFLLTFLTTSGVRLLQPFGYPMASHSNSTSLSAFSSSLVYVFYVCFVSPPVYLQQPLSISLSLSLCLLHFPFCLYLQIIAFSIHEIKSILI